MGLLYLAYYSLLTNSISPSWRELTRTGTAEDGGDAKIMQGRATNPIVQSAANLLTCPLAGRQISD
jgi:hypothetical protein